jgi:hypothetical protein
MQAGVAPRPPGLRRALLRLQRGVQRRLQAQVRAHTGGHSPALARYYREYLRDLRRRHAPSNYGELHQAMLDSDIVLVGDYHTLRQSQELALRLLERAALDPRPVCLALEMVRAEHQAPLDAFLGGELDEAAFLRAIDYRQTWNFEWGNYRPLFDAARRAGVRVVGVNHIAGTLRERDARIAASLVDLVGAAPERRVLVLIGELHLAANHLPAALQRGFADREPAPRQLVVYQNSDSLYWSLAQRGSETDTQVVRLGSDRFCVLEVPPHVKLQSYLGWEQVQERWAEESAWDGESDGPSCAAIVSHLVTHLAAFVGLPAVDAHVDVYGQLDEAFFDALAAAELDPALRREIQLHAFSNRSVWVPELNAVYLPYLSINHAAEEAAHVLQTRTGGFVPVTGDAFEDFYARALWACVGYAASKIVNPRRRAPGEAELRVFSNAASRRLHEPELAFRKLVARFVLQHKEQERARSGGRRGRLKQIYEQDLEVTLDVCWTLGTLLGEDLAAALRQGLVAAADFRALIVAPRGPHPSETYFELAARLDRQR